jgi:uncharacterized membrane protein required for colicin V production
MNIDAQYFSWIDWTIVIAAVLVFVSGIFHGFSKEVKSLLAWTIAPIIAYAFYGDVAQIDFMQNIGDVGLRSSVSFLSIYLSISFLLGMLLSLVLKMVIGPWASILAGILSLFKWLLIFSFVTVMAKESIPSHIMKPLQSAYLYASIQSIADTFFNKMEEGFNSRDKLSNTFNEKQNLYKENKKLYKEKDEQFKDVESKSQKMFEDLDELQKSFEKVNDN